MARRRGGAATLAGLLKRRAHSRTMSVTERLPLTQSHVLHLVDVGGRALLIATHPQGVSFLSEESSGTRFSQVLDERILGRMEPAGQMREGS